MIEIRNLRKTYITGNKELHALDGIDLRIEEKTFTSIVGRSGSGKSTLLHLMGLLDSPTSGEILIGGRDINKFRGKEQAIYRNRNIGFVFQSFHLEPTYTVYENMEIPMLIANIDKGERRKRIELRLNEVGLLERQKEIVNNLSGGEKQRVAIARALVNGAEIVLADEPCGNLDTENGAKIMRLLRGLADSGITVVLVTHNLKDAEISDRIVTIQNGKILDSKLLNDSASVNAARIAEENNNI